MGWRLRHHFLLKSLGITAFMWLFFALYFHLLRNPVGPVMLMPLTALDHAIPMQPTAFFAYASLWVYVGIPPGLMLSLREVFIYGLWIGALCAVGLGCFYFWPTAVPVHDFGPLDVRDGGMALLRGVDAAGNACPSLHVATATFTAIWLHRLLRLTQARPVWSIANGLWLLLIIYSTLAIKQHVVIDAASGAVLALVFAGLSLRFIQPAVRP